MKPKEKVSSLENPAKKTCRYFSSVPFTVPLSFLNWIVIGYQYAFSGCPNTSPLWSLSRFIERPDMLGFENEKLNYVNRDSEHIPRGLPPGGFNHK
jgi:lipocalin